MARPTTLLSLLVGIIAGTGCASALALPPTPQTSQSAGVRVEEQGFIAIGGISQWVTISGADRLNPVVLFLHGGPGNPLSPYARSLYGGWTDSFTVVQWDQRGAGRTFGRNPQTADAPLTIDLMVRDGIEVAEYLKRHLGAEKILLVGGSWGSALGVHMVKQRPDLFRLYVGVGQLVEEEENQTSTMIRLRALAEAAGDQPTLDALAALGPPPWANPRNFGILRRLTRPYEARAADAAPSSWWVPDPTYATASYQAEYEAGEDYSYLQFVGARGNGLLAAVDLRRLGSRFDLPIYLVQGAEDLVTTPDVARAWFDTIEAPQKQFVLVQRTGHDPNVAGLAAIRSVLDAHKDQPPGSRRPD